MNNVERLKKIAIIIFTVTALLVFCFSGTGCGDPTQRYSNDRKTTPVAGGGDLIAFVERQAIGTLSGNTRSVDYRVTGEYTGSKPVVEIRSTWTVDVQYKRMTSSSYNASLSVGSDSVSTTVGSGASYEYTTISKSKYWSNTNGINSVYYGPSNYTMWPDSQVNSHSIRNTVYLKISGHATPFEITAIT